MHISHHQAAVLGRVVYLGKLRQSALGLYDHGAVPARIRASVVARRVAADVDVEDSPSFRADLTQALRAAGWRSVRVENVRYWKGVRAR